jgi:hypothetical protein
VRRLKSEGGTVRVPSADPHMHHLVVYFTSHQARGSRQLGRSGCTRLLFSLQFQICSLNLSLSRVRITHVATARTAGYRVPGSTAIRRPMQVALAAATHVLANAPGNAHSARPPAAQRRTSFLSHSALSAVSLATASAFSLAVSSARSASSRPTAAACVCAARTAHDWMKA